MSRLYDAAEPTVIDEKLLRSLILEQGPNGEAGKIIEKEGVEFHEVLEIRIDFKNVQHIENLWQLQNLVKLRLDNNIIATITGLDQLVHLEWLDLSFNNITTIEGIDKLVKLKDLSLAHNLIKEVGGLSTLTSLQVLSLGYNKLHNLNSTSRYLRKLSSLQTLCLKGNKFSRVPAHSGNETEEEAYRSYQMNCIAFIPSLVYLDYQMILQETRALALEQHKEDLDEILRNEREERAKKEENNAIQAIKQQHTLAYVDGLEQDEFFHSLFEDDTEASRLELLPGEKERLEEYCQEVVKISSDIVSIGLEEENKRTRERELFQSAYQKALELNQKSSSELIQKYEEDKAKLLNDHQIDTLGEKISKLHHDVMTLEMQLVDQLEDISKEFERNYTDMVSHMIEGVQAKMTQLREYEKNHHETVLELSTQLMESYSKGLLEEELPDGLRVLFADKDTLLSAINAAHDVHMQVIDNKEDSIRGRGEKDKKNLLDGLTQKLHKRNRERVTEISHFIDLQHDELEDWLGTKEQ